jgi:integrase
MAEGEEPGDLLFRTEGGSQLHRTATLRPVNWRRIHDLRHTAACLWLARGVDPGTVQAWMGHESIATTNLYLHFLGTGAHRTGLELLNRPRGAAGGPSHDSAGESQP